MKGKGKSNGGKNHGMSDKSRTGEPGKFSDKAPTGGKKPVMSDKAPDPYKR